MPATTGELQFQTLILVSVHYVICACFSRNLITMGCLQLYYTPNDSCVIENASFLSKAAKQIQSSICGPVHTSLSHYFVCKYIYDSEPQNAYNFTKHQTKNNYDKGCILFSSTIKPRLKICCLYISLHIVIFLHIWSVYISNHIYLHNCRYS